MRGDLRWMEELIRIGDPLTLGLTAWLCVALFASGFALVATRRAWPVALSATILTTFLVASVAALAWQRWQMVRVFTREAEPGLFWWGIAASWEITTAHLLGPALVLAAPCTLLALGRVKPGARGFCAAAAVLVAAAGASHVVAMHGLWRGFLRIGCEPFWTRVAAEIAGFSHAAPWREAALVAVAIATFGALLVSRLRSGRRSSPSARALAAVVFVVGALGFGLTRGHAHDARNARSLRSDSMPSRLDLPTVPEAQRDRCERDAYGPTLEIDAAGEARLDGVARDPEAVVEHLSTLRRNWSVLHPREPFDGRLYLVAPKAWPEAAARWLTRAKSAGWTEVADLYLDVELVRTRTMGEVRVERRCAVARRPVSR